MKISFLMFLLMGTTAFAQMPVTDLANLVNNELMQIENLAQWAESIEQLRMQIDQLNKQIAISDDIRKWAGNPTEASAKIALNAMGAGDLVRTYGRAKETIMKVTDSLEALKDTGEGTFRALVDLDLEGKAIIHDEKTFRRYSILNAKQANADSVASQTAARIKDLQNEIAAASVALKAASTDAESQKQSAKLSVLTGQLAQVESERRRQVDEVSLQKIANDTRREQELLAAAELEAKDAYIANRRISDYMRTLRVRRASP